MLRKLFIFFVVISYGLGVNSCISTKEITYFQDQGRDTMILSGQVYNVIFNPGDIITISVSAVDMDAVRPFNLPVVTFAADGGIGGRQALQDYLIDIDGFIDFPILGELKLIGLNRKQATEYLQKKLQTYIQDPIVNIRLRNFKITILGEVNNPGAYIVENERITLPEALGLAGDLTISGKRDNILLIRDVNGQKTKTRIDLTTNEIFSSPVYYLAQNDIIYVEPKKAKIRDSSFGTSTSVTVSIVSTLISLLVLILR